VSEALITRHSFPFLSSFQLCVLLSDQAHRRIKGDSEWESVTAKVARTEPTWKDMRVICYVAVIADDPDACPVASQVIA